MSIINYRERYSSQTSEFTAKLGVKNVQALPKISKVTVNVGLGQHRQSKEMVKYINDTLTLVTGQKPAETKAKKSIAGFKIRQGDHVGLKVTLRGGRMNDFINRLINITLPRIRDFKGIQASQIDKQGNLTIGLKDQVPFAEVGYDSIDKQFGLTITMTISQSDPAKSYKFLQLLGFPMDLSNDLGFQEKIN